MSDTRLARALPPHASRADAARALAQDLADRAAVLVGGPPRPLPRLPDLAVGDQVAVTGTDLVLAAAGHPDPGGLVAAAVERCRALRLAL